MIDCSSAGCTNFTAVNFRVQEPGDYFIRIDWSGRSYFNQLSKIEFRGYTASYANSVATGLVKIFLLIYTIADFSCFCCNLRRARLLALSKRVQFSLCFEQKVMIGLNIAMLLFFDPVGIAHVFNPTVFTYRYLT